MPPVSDLRSDSPLNFICVACSYLGSSEHLNRARMFTVVAIVRFCCHRDVFGFHDPSEYSQPFESHAQLLPAAQFPMVLGVKRSPVRRCNCSPKVIAMSQLKDIPCRHCPSPGLGVNLVWISIKLRSCLPEYRVVPVGLFAKTMALASAYCRGPRV